jgi:DNA-binding CsgD family transcriptional regulator
LDAAEAVLDVSIPLTIERDIPVCQAWQIGVRGRLSFLRGEWDRALDDASEVLAGQAAPLTRSWPHLVRGLVALRRGTDGAAADLDRAWELANGYAEPLRVLPAMAALAERAWLHGLDDPRLDDAGDVVGQHRSTPGTDWSRGDLVVWLARLGRPVRPDDRTVAEPYRLLLGGATDRAAAALAERSMPYERALALVDSGRAEDAAEALAVLDRIGADAVAAKIRRDLRERGVTAIPARPRTSTRSNLAGLTARQLEVLQLLDDGLTNAQLAETLFISPKTVDHHVSAILAKLQVPTRSEAAAAGRRLGLVR